MKVCKIRQFIYAPAPPNILLLYQIKAISTICGRWLRQNIEKRSIKFKRFLFPPELPSSER